MGYFNNVVRRANLRIENALVFLKYTYKELTKEQFKDIDISKFDTLTEVYTSCLLKCIDILTKRGLYKEYIKREDEEMKSPKGKINVSQSITRQTNLRGSLICSYEELSANVLHNKIIKTILRDLLYNKDIKKEQTIQIRKQLTSFNDIDTIDVNTIKFNRIKYNNNNLRYKTIMDICNDLYFKINVNKYLKGEDTFTFEDNLFIAFRKHLFNYYKSIYGDIYHLDTLEVPLNEEISDKFDLIYSKYKKIIIIETDKKAVLIDCYKNEEFIDIKKKDKQEDELRKIVNKFKRETKLDVSGAIIYVNCTEGYNLNKTELSNNNDIVILNTTIDTNIKYNYIDYKLRKAVDTLLDE